MLAAPTPSQVRSALINRTNDRQTHQTTVSSFFSPLTFSEHTKAKRPIADASTDGRLTKRSRLSGVDGVDAEESYEEHDSDVEMLDVAADPQPRQRRVTVHGMMSLNAMSRPRAVFRQLPLPTRLILRSFVSSHKADVFKCQSLHANAFLTPPYACSYGHTAKKGGIPLLAVATEQGAVHILDTSKRNDWGYEPQRTVLDIHQNGVFDVQWSHTDELLATVSGDQSTRVTDLTTSKTLHTLRNHTSTVKTVAWDPVNPSMLSTGGRDGVICLWDMRAQGQRSSECGIDVLTPVLRIPCAGGHVVKARRATTPAMKSVTSVLYLDGDPFGLTSSSSFDGILRHWDIRLPTSPRKGKSALRMIQPTHVSSFDPTTVDGSRRPRGIASLVAGAGPSAGLLFGLGTDSRIHTYMASTLLALPSTEMTSFAHPSMQTNSFYVRLALSPNGRWLLSGSASRTGSAFLFDVSCAGRTHPTLSGSRSIPSHGVEIKGQTGEVGAVDWAEGMFATCADDGTVRIWRDDIDIARMCEADADNAKWDWAWAVDGGQPQSA